AARHRRSGRDARRRLHHHQRVDGGRGGRRGDGGCRPPLPDPGPQRGAAPPAGHPPRPGRGPPAPPAPLPPQPGWAAGPGGAGGPPARLEMLARRAAASPVDREPLRGAGVFARFDRTPTPPAIAAAAEDLTSFAPLDVQSYREAASGAVVHCLVAPGLPAPELAPFASELAQVMAQIAPSEAPGACRSAVLRAGNTRVEIGKLPAPAGLSQILVVAGGDTGRPGLARLQVERTAARLSEA